MAGPSTDQTLPAVQDTARSKPYKRPALVKGPTLSAVAASGALSGNVVPD